jgi:RNA polymerase sigma-70 factor (ECF subfamily)
MLQTALDFFGRQDDAEDVTQDAMLQLWRYCEQIDGCRNVTGLAVRVAKNCCVSHHRRQRTEADYEALKHSTGEDYSPQQLLEADEAQRMIDEVLARLKPRERELFEMRRIEGFSTKQIAEQTGIPERSVSAMVSAARKKVFTELIKRMKQ